MEGKNSKESSTKSLYSPQSVLAKSIPTMSEISHLMDDCLMESDMSLSDFDAFYMSLHQ